MNRIQNFVLLLLISFSMVLNSCSSCPTPPAWGWQPDPYVWDGKGCLVNQEGHALCGKDLEDIVGFTTEDLANYKLEKAKQLEFVKAQGGKND